VPCSWRNSSTTSWGTTASLTRPKTDRTTRKCQRLAGRLGKVKELTCRLSMAEDWHKSPIRLDLQSFSSFVYRPWFLATPVLSGCRISDDLLLRDVFVWFQFCFLCRSACYSRSLCVAFLGQDLFSVFLYAVPVMSEKSTKVSRNFFGDADKTRLFFLFRH
jgi:hypothetical protein